MDKLCPCGSQKTYQACCELLISGQRAASTCQELMRSRYVAFTLAHVEPTREFHKPAKKGQN